MTDAGAALTPTWSVGELHEALNGLLTHVFGDEVWVEGELRNFKRSKNQHVYFDLVDPSAESDVNRPMLAVTLFSTERQRVNRFLTQEGGNVRMGDGVRVRIRGRLNVYAARSTLQLRMTWIDPAFTLGVLGQDRDRVLAALLADGVLRSNAANPLSDVPMRVALVTSVGSAAHADALDELERSGLGFQVSVLDARTQGLDAEASIIAGLRTAESLDVDVVLLVRGGGARTDLAAFDSEAVARTIAALRIAVLTGVGHEIDRTVADEVAHTAHKTPTAAAAALVARSRRSADELQDVWAQLRSATRGRLVRASHGLDETGRRAGRAATRHLDRDVQQIRHLSDRIRVAAPRTTSGAQSSLDELGRRLPAASRRGIERSTGALDGLGARARLHDPALALARGWTITRTSSGAIVRSVDQLVDGQLIETQLPDGTATSTVQGVERSTTEGAHPEADAAISESTTPDRPTT